MEGLVNASNLILLVALITVVGCATESQPLVVAYGRLLSQHDDIELRVARFEALEIQRGQLPTNVVEVVFWKKTQTGDLPREAILLLSHPLAISPSSWYAVGEDASRSILPDTSTARSRIASSADDRILDNPKAERLSRSTAEQIVRDYLRTEGISLARIRLVLRRTEFGWTASVSFPDEQGNIPVGGESSIGIRDSRDILYWSKGL
jgi:hypothetical protein